MRDPYVDDEIMNGYRLLAAAILKSESVNNDEIVDKDYRSNLVELATSKTRHKSSISQPESVILSKIHNTSRIVRDNS